MGRVYNALVKADRLTGQQRPIGRPTSQDAATKDTEVFRAPVAPLTIDENSAKDFSLNHGRAAVIKREVLCRIFIDRKGRDRRAKNFSIFGRRVLRGGATNRA